MALAGGSVGDEALRHLGLGYRHIVCVRADGLLVGVGIEVVQTQRRRRMRARDVYRAKKACCSGL